MTTEFLKDLLERYENGKCTNEETLWVENWYNNLSLGTITDSSNENIAIITKRIEGKLDKLQSASRPLKLKYYLSWQKWASIAAILVLLCGSILYLNQLNFARSSFLSKHEKFELITQTNLSGHMLTVSLSDGTKINLRPQASLIYPKVFAGNKREVFLQGRAFFSVAKNQLKPFYVYNDAVVVKVLGTSFDVNVNEQGTNVEVRTGKVQVTENEQRKILARSGHEVKSGILLIPNQKGVFVEKGQKLIKTLVDEPVVLTEAHHEPSALNYSYASTPVKTVISQLSKDYGIDIRFKDNQKGNCRFTGDINVHGLYDKINLVCQSISATFKLEGTTIFIYGANCE